MGERAERHYAPLGSAGLPVVSVGVTTPQHRADLFLDPGSDPRQGGLRLGEERTTLTEFLRCQRLTKRYQTDADLDADFNGAVADPAAVAEACVAWGEEVAFAEQFTRDHDLGFAGRDSEGEAVWLRELLVHMIEEYARLNGRADLLRGRVGQ